MKRRPADPLYVELSREVARAGYFAKSPGGYLWRGVLLLVLFVACYVSLLFIRNLVFVAFALVAMAQLVTQLAYLSHDAGHRPTRRFMGLPRAPAAGSRSSVTSA
jgi:fatty acid desaturase